MSLLVCWPANGGDGTSFGALDALESHVNGLEILRDCAVFAIMAGGAPHGIEGREPEKPFNFEFEPVESLGGRLGLGVGCCEVLEVIVDERDLSACASSKLTSSSDVVDNRCAVRRGDLVWLESGSGSSTVFGSSGSVCFCFRVMESSLVSTPFGVVPDEDEGRRCVSDREDEAADIGRLGGRTTES